ncbi:nuclear transport factor 2 family protein [Balneola sp. MJW-20]|uniref:nuclear transport factor 2 family protein n=1 Tax=Gracilimonas aurantiaca TaxID=3234185 RepID=UPI00390B9F0B
MHPNEKLIHTLYSAFSKRDHTTMADCYHEEACFRDEVFELEGKEQVAGMWQMLCERGDDLKIQFSDITADAQTGSAHWVADYTFSQTGRKVQNSIAASFIFQNGLILEHTDSFDFWAWSNQSLGFTGLFLGWTGWLKTKIRRKARYSLDQYLANK